MSSRVTLNTSVHILEQKITKWFQLKYGTKVWFPGHGSSFSPPKKEILTQDGGCIHVVLFGNFYSQLLKCTKWPAATYKLWVLGSSSRQVVNQMFGLPENCIGVIPRYELFPYHRQGLTDPYLNRSGPWSLVYSGRFSHSKNFETSLKVASYLQTHFAEEVSLIGLGNFDQIGREDQGRGQFPNFKKHIEKLIKTLKWKYRPQFFSHLSSEEWTKLQLPSPVLINLSLFYMDDFGVSVAQAQQQGWACILSDWGGHRDVKGNNVLKISPNFLDHDEHILNVAELIHRHKDKLLCPLLDIKRTTMNTPLPIERQDLIKARAHALLQFSSQLMAIGQVQEPILSAFSQTPEGQAFFAQYHHHFAGGISWART